MGAPFPNGGKPQHLNGTATTTPATIGPNAPALASQESATLVVTNTDATNNLLLSFDGGVNFFTVRPATTVTLPVGVKSAVVKSSAASVVYSILWISVV